jgi:hypothetical protein
MVKSTLTTQEVILKINKIFEKNLIPNHSLQIKCVSFNDPKIFNKPINQLQNEKNNQNLQ